MRQKCSSISWPRRTRTGVAIGKKIGNQLNMPESHGITHVNQILLSRNIYFDFKTFGVSLGPDAQRDVLVQHGLEISAEPVQLGIDVDGEGARIEAVAVDLPGKRMLEGEELLRLGQLRLVLEADNVGGLEVAFRVLVRVAARPDLVVEFRRLKWANLEYRGKKHLLSR